MYTFCTYSIREEKKVAMWGVEGVVLGNTQWGLRKRGSITAFSQRGRILERNWDKVLIVFLLAIHRHLYKWIPSPSPTPSKGGLKLVCNVYGNLKAENSQDYAQKLQRN
jgi:hypothetical protein